MANFHFN